MPGILTKQLSDQRSYFAFLNTVPHEEPSPKHIKIQIQNQKAISDFIHEIIPSEVYNKFNKSPSVVPNINDNILDESIQ